MEDAPFGPASPLHPGEPMRKTQPVPTGRTVLVVDDQQETLEAIKPLLQRDGHRVLVADRGAKALALLEQHDVQVMLIDYFMPVMNGELLIRAIRNRNATVQIILQTGYAGEKPAREMMRALAIQGYHDKCDGPERLLLWVDVALKAYDQTVALHRAERQATEALAELSDAARSELRAIRGAAARASEGLPDSVAAPLQEIMARAAALLGRVEEPAAAAGSAECGAKAAEGCTP